MPALVEYITVDVTGGWGWGWSVNGFWVVSTLPSRLPVLRAEPGQQEQEVLKLIAQPCSRSHTKKYKKKNQQIKGIP